MSPLDAAPRNALSGCTARVPPRPYRPGLGRAMILLLVAIAIPSEPGWAGKVNLVRKYRVGQTMVYTTEVRTLAQVNSHPVELKSFFPAVPPELTMRQQNTVTVTAVHPDGAADIQHRIDRFEILNDLTGLPDAMR